MYLFIERKGEQSLQKNDTAEHPKGKQNLLLFHKKHLRHWKR